MVTRDHILEEIRRTAGENGGVALGRGRFRTETGISEHDWRGRYWARWSDAVAEAGVSPNMMTARIDDDELLNHLARAVRRFSRVPTEAERRMLRRDDPTFPSHSVFWRLGGRRDQLDRLAEFCRVTDGYQDVFAFIEPALAKDPQPTAPQRSTAEITFGEVYLIRVGRNYKLGRTNAFGRRERELAIQLPERATTAHVIRTDDPEGIEAYWHRRFADRRGNGEWFALTTDDVAAFRRRKFM